MKNKEKDFDAVKMMREIREKLGKEYEADPRLREKRLKEIQKKYGLKPGKKQYSHFSRTVFPGSRERRL
ncbi:MAG: hypothetical protein KAW12_22725 [Candidatus Aminicenantes bacterium]|nr:hypothetical protein [Candidatus Aminicenantes bacterium]